MKKIKYVGPSDSVDAAGLTFVRNHQVEVDDDVAGAPEDPRRTGLVAELAEATGERDHQRQRDLRDAIVALGPDAMGSGLLAQDVFVEVAPKAKNKEDDQ